MKSFTTPLRDIGYLSIALTLALTANFAYGQWANPTQAPTGGNITPPVNTGSVAQSKSGNFGATTLTSFGASRIVNGTPTQIFTDTNNRDYFQVVADGNMHFMSDRTQVGDSNPWGGGWPYALSLVATGPTVNDEFARFSNTVRATAYCDITGANCFTPGTGGGGTPEVPTNYEVGSLLMAALTGSFPANTSIGYGQVVAGGNICPAGFFLYDTNDNDKIGIVDGTGTTCNVSVPGKWQVLGATNQASGLNLNTGNTTASITLFQRVEDSTPITPAYYWQQTGASACSAPVSCSGGSQTLSYSCKNSATGATVAASNCGSNPYPASRSCNRDTGQCSCFIAGTEVQMADGSVKNIEDVTIGEQVLGTDGVANTVLGYDRPMLGTRLLYSFNGGEYFVTAEHPFLTTDGWKSLSVPALIAEDPDLAEALGVTTLEVGDEIMRLDGTTQLIETIDSQAAPDQQLYNFILDGNNTYHADEYVTHNKGGG